MTRTGGDFPEAVASHSHLFPGAVLRVTPRGSHEDLVSNPSALTIVFSDGAKSHAEVLVAVATTVNPGGETALIVDGYTTTAGAVIPQKMWRLAGQMFDGEQLTLRIGSRMPLL
jgi:hypothetical protein